MFVFIRLSWQCLIILGCSLCLASEPATSPRNVILIIGDGMDDQQITIARNYLQGASGRLLIDELPVRAAVQVLTVNEDAPEQAVYVADSANSATAMATGVVTSRGRIATSAQADQDLTTIIELAQAAGLSTGVVTTASVTDATPASFVAHISKRYCQSPELMVDGLAYGLYPVSCQHDTKANGGLGSIAEQLAGSDVDVILGGGLKYFQTNAEGEKSSVLQQAKNNGFEVITQLGDVDSVSVDKKILGLFAASTMPIQWQGEKGRVAEKPVKSWLNRINQQWGEVVLPEPMKCEANPKSESVPKLATMTQLALKKLSGSNGFNNKEGDKGIDKGSDQADDKGFFLMVESASIDKASHSRDACGSIGEVAQLNDVVRVALRFAEQQPNTLILVTADHGQAAQLIPQQGLFAKSIYNVPVGTPGSVARIITPEGSVMAVNYATNEIFAEEHTGVNVPLLANGVAVGMVKPLIAQPDLFHIMAEYLALPH